MTPPILRLPDDFAVGQRIAPSAKYRRIYSRSKVEEGVVVAGAMGGRGLRVQFDGQTSCQNLDVTFLERV